jgi:hypothetical protein
MVVCEAFLLIAAGCLAGVVLSVAAYRLHGLEATLSPCRSGSETSIGIARTCSSSPVRPPRLREGIYILDSHGMTKPQSRQALYRSIMKPSFIGSTVAIVIGVISIGTQLSHLNKWVHMDNIVGGITAIFGAVAYRLAKERRLGLKLDSVVLRSMEMALVAVVVGTPVLQTIMGVDFATRPWSNLLIPVWTFAAYLWVRLKKTATTRLTC